ncbi:MAG: sel1 repeat family protein [Rhodospirillales bacterium]|nr:sel1 repeat family protein [Rhodospirillales bacterium]
MKPISRLFSARGVLSVAAFFLLFTIYPLSADAQSWIEAYRNKDYETARTKLEPLAEEGDGQAQMVLGMIYHKGLGVDKDFGTAASWYRKAADEGNTAAQSNLGVMYRRGEGVEKSAEDAFSLFWTAAVLGYPRAEYNLSDMYRKGEGVSKNLVLAYVWLEFAVSDLPKSGRHSAVNRRAAIVGEMSTEEVIRAERMAKALRQSRQ